MDRGVCTTDSCGSSVVELERNVAQSEEAVCLDNAR